jgi:hypothetical protein
LTERLELYWLVQTFQVRTCLPQVSHLSRLEVLALVVVIFQRVTAL